MHSSEIVSDSQVCNIQSDMKDLGVIWQNLNLIRFLNCRISFLRSVVFIVALWTYESFDRFLIPVQMIQSFHLLANSVICCSWNWLSTVFYFCSVLITSLWWNTDDMLPNYLIIFLVPFVFRCSEFSVPRYTLEDYESRNSDNSANHLFGNQKHLSIGVPETVTWELAVVFC